LIPRFARPLARKELFPALVPGRVFFLPKPLALGETSDGWIPGMSFHPTTSLKEEDVSFLSIGVWWRRRGWFTYGWHVFCLLLPQGKVRKGKEEEDMQANLTSTKEPIERKGLEAQTWYSCILVLSFPLRHLLLPSVAYLYSLQRDGKKERV
tara:strand:+ start:663 stop:1118 length:456 start_codon:yes stop_codon:yes gene_type:complete